MTDNGTVQAIWRADSPAATARLAALLASAVALLIGAAVGLFLKIPPRVMLDLDPANRWKEPDINVPIEPRSGPIVISIEYRIRPQRIQPRHHSQIAALFPPPQHGPERKLRLARIPPPLDRLFDMRSQLLLNLPAHPLRANAVGDTRPP